MLEKGKKSFIINGIEIVLIALLYDKWGEKLFNKRICAPNLSDYPKNYERNKKGRLFFQPCFTK